MKTLGLYTPFPLEPGGGERYLLSVAEVFRGEFEVFLITPEQQSADRVERLARELDVQVEPRRLQRGNLDRRTAAGYRIAFGRHAGVVYRQYQVDLPECRCGKARNRQKRMAATDARAPNRLSGLPLTR